MSILLNSQSDTLSITTSSTSEISYFMSYDVLGSDKFSSSVQGLIATATNTEAIGSPAPNKSFSVTNIFIVNNGVSSNTIQVNKISGGVSHGLISKNIAFLTKQSLQYNSETGWKRFSASGEEMVTTSTIWGDITGTLSNQTDLQSALDAKVAKNSNITGATKTKITFDAKGLVTAGADATTADIADSSNKRYVTDAQLTVIGNTSGINTGDQNLSGYALISSIKANTIFTQTATKTVTGGSETTLIGMGVGSVALSANVLIAGKTIRVQGGGIYSALIVPGNLTFKLKLNSVTLATGVITNLLSLASNNAFDFSAEITCRSTGITGTVNTSGKIAYDIGVLTQGAVALNNGGTNSVVDTTIGQTLDLTVQWATSDAGNTISSTVLSVELLN